MNPNLELRVHQVVVIDLSVPTLVQSECQAPGTMDSQIYLKNLSKNVRSKFSNVVEDEREMNSKISIEFIKN